MKRGRVSAIINLLEPDDQLQPLTAERPVGIASLWWPLSLN